MDTLSRMIPPLTLTLTLTNPNPNPNPNPNQEHRAHRRAIGRERELAVLVGRVLLSGLDRGVVDARHAHAKTARLRVQRWRAVRAGRVENVLVPQAALGARTWLGFGFGFGFGLGLG